ncbi:GNAT family N-acetyltransferase [Oscillochloris sp. ZM17-4]|uniref:GNAT family N-acetyltransferase n=1 Tax=Oscillochloris sp. ZM17-4 TaxID=2866714 RepID=UPI001C73CF05|nr:GNAT family N-acetyltransferase [Oscillochloris sp. ZM17-4]MBX0327987.1 GNAT family N-acetyltransferase [Oscillochloris sp. ZM17-4]
MPDLLVRLYALPPLEPALIDLAGRGVAIRRATPNEAPALAAWVRRHFQEVWAVECETAMSQRPVGCFLALRPAAHVPAHPYDLTPQELLGFACYDTTARGMFGPTGVHPAARGGGVGAALLLKTMHAMREEGYHYAVIGWAGPVAWYERTVGATVIAGSEPGGYVGGLIDPQGSGGELDG